MPKHSYYLPSRKLVSQADAAMVARPQVPRSRFIGQWQHLKTFDAGKLYPFMVDEILPGDHMRYNVTAYVRMATALFPQFSNQRLDTFFFFVPARILWDNWTKFMGEQKDPSSSINYTVPVVAIDNTVTANSIADHFGLPINNITAGQTIDVNCLPFRAYVRIWNDWFRDQNVVNSALVTTGDGPDSIGNYEIKYRMKGHDYFTSALPWPQKFTPLQTLFTGTAPVTGVGLQQTDTPIAGPLNAIETGNITTAYPNYVSTASGVANEVIFRFDTLAAAAPPAIYADLSRATGVTINALRQAWLVQDLLERDARGGTRYVELIRSHFGVTSPDFRVQRPEYIGGGQTPLNITPIAQTATGGGGLGALGGVGTAAGQHSASYAATEHGYILGLINIRTELAYQQGIHKLWTRSVRTDFYFPSLAGLGEQAILRQEIYATGINNDDGAVFGYQERWHEYRTRTSEVTGMFRSNAPSDIDEWHLAQYFSAAPTLSQSFLQDDPPMSRILASGALSVNQQYLADILIQRQAVRPIPMFGTPATLSRF